DFVAVPARPIVPLSVTQTRGDTVDILNQEFPVLPGRGGKPAVQFVNETGASAGGNAIEIPEYGDRGSFEIVLDDLAADLVADGLPNRLVSRQFGFQKTVEGGFRAGYGWEVLDVHPVCVDVYQVGLELPQREGVDNRIFEILIVFRLVKGRAQTRLQQKDLEEIDHLVRGHASEHGNAEILQGWFFQ